MILLLDEISKYAIRLLIRAGCEIQPGRIDGRGRRRGKGKRPKPVDDDRMAMRLQLAQEPGVLAEYVDMAIPEITHQYYRVLRVVVHIIDAATAAVTIITIPSLVDLR